jgi:EmrB/QacA subfamily drug resistance transporter
MTESTSSRLDPALMRMAWVLILGVLAPVLDSTIVAIALDRLSGQLHVPIATIQWVSTGYLLALAGVIPIVAWLQKLWGGKRLWLAALALFLLGSVLSACAWDAPSLVAFRVVQGLGAGVLFPLMQSLLMQAAGGRPSGRTVALVSLPIALGPILGPVVGGVILNWLDWRWLFLINVPVCIAALLLAGRVLPNDPKRAGARPRLDVVGMVLLVPGLVGVLYGLSNAHGDGGFTRADVLGPGLAGLVLVAAFAVWAVRQGPRALVDLRLLRSRPLAASTAVMFLSGIALYGAMLLLPLYWQNVRGTTVLVAALLLIPQGIGSLLSRTVAAVLAERIGARWVAVLSFALITVTTIPFALADGSTNEWWLMIVLFARGFGLGAAMIPIMTVAYIGIRGTDVPHASMLTRTAQQIGGSFGTAMLAVVLQSVVGSGGSPDLAHGFEVTFWIAVGLSGAAVVVSLLLPGRAAIVSAVSAAPTPAQSSLPKQSEIAESA